MTSGAIIVDTFTPALQRLSRGMADLTPVMNDIGEYLAKSTKERFPTGKGPAGQVWPAKSPVTLERYKKTGGGTHPLFGPSGDLNSNIFSEASATSVTWGSDRVYARMMQYGGTRAQWPHLWGNIPARPFLGVSAEDEVKIMASLTRYIEDLAGQP